MPWAPELFSAPSLERLLNQRRRDELASVPYFYGLVAGEPGALVGSFADEPELHDPVRGRVKGVQAFESFVADMSEWFRERQVTVEDVSRVILERRGFEEVILHLDGDTGPVQLPVAIVADKGPGGLIRELRVYSSSWPLTGTHLNRPPLLQPDAELDLPDVVAAYQAALGSGDTDAVLATLEPDGSVREPAGGHYSHGGPERMRAFFQWLFSNGGGIVQQPCAVVDDGALCALEYNVVQWGLNRLPPQAGVCVFTRGDSGRLAAVRLYDDAEPPHGPRF